MPTNEEYALKVFHHDSNLLFERLNYFLLGTSFLIAAFVATIVVNSSNTLFTSNVLETITNAICLVGLVLSIFFIVVNHLNSRLLSEYAILFTHTFDNHNEAMKAVYSNLGGTKNVISSFFIDLKGAIHDPIEQGKKTPGLHTWLIPLGFSVFWFVIWFVVLPWHYFKFLFLIGALVVYVWYSSLEGNNEKREETHMPSIGIKTVIAICVLILVVVTVVATNHSALGQGLYVAATFALAFIALWTITKSEEQNRKIIINNKIEQRSRRREQLLNELRDWVRQIIVELGDLGSLQDLFDLAAKVDKKDDSGAMSEFKRGLYYSEKKNNSAMLGKIWTLSDDDIYMMNIASEFTLDKLVSEFSISVIKYLEILNKTILSSEEMTEEERANSTKEQENAVTTVRDQGNAILKRISELKVEEVRKW